MANAPKLSKPAREFHKLATREGFELVKVGKHLHYRLPGANEMLIVSSTPSDHRSMKNAAARMRRITRQAAAA
jgi:hypothetical protein